MLYIIIALKPEAQAFVDKYKLTKTKLEKFTLHVNKNMTVITSGIGPSNANIATTKIIEKFNPTEKDIILNVGICGADEKYKIGQLIDGFKNRLTCVDKEVNIKNKYELVDMESAGFLEATNGMKNIYMYKVVSDHFEPHKVTKENTKKLIFDKLDEIMTRIGDRHA